MGVLDLSVGTGPLRAEHERLLRTALRRGDNTPERRADEQVDVAAYEAPALQAAHRVWRRRAFNEHQSAMVFTGLLPQLVEAEATLDMKTTVLRMAMDELRHGALCAGIVEAMGGDPALHADLEVRPLPEHPGCTPLERAMRNALFIGCLAETVAVAFTAEEREQTSEPLMRRAIEQISADETLHARFGWAFVSEAAPHLDEAARVRTNSWLRIALRYLEREEMLEVPDVRPPSDELREQGLALGVCDNGATRELFYETVREAILPGLEALGFGAHEAWRQRLAS